MRHLNGSALSAPSSPLGIDAVRMRSISHHSAPLADLERMALSPASRIELRERLAARGVQAVLLCTCNRTELYWHSRGPEDDRVAEDALHSAAQPGPPLPADSFQGAAGLDAAAHLFRVTAGLESMVVGESEILGQAREAIESAERDGSAGLFLPHLFRAAVRFGGLARTETRIGAGALSVASAAVQLLSRVHEDLTACTVLVLGAGVTGQKAARHLVAERVGRVVLLNRTVERSREAAAELGVEAGALEELPARLAEADAVIAAAQVESPLVTPELLRVLPADRPGALVLLDLSLPRAIASDCAAHPRVVLHDLSGFEQVVASNRARREREIPRVEELLARELRIFEARMRESRVRPLVAELRLRAERIRREELERVRQQMGASGAEALDHITRRLVDRLLDVPSQALRSGDLALDPQHTGYLRALFGLGARPETDDERD